MERVRQLDREVGAVREHDTGVEHASPGIAAQDALGPDTILRHVLVAGRVRCLHRRDHAEFGEARNVFKRDDLGVFDTIAQR